MSKKRVVVTGAGVITPVGHDLDSFWNALVEGRSGIGPIESFDASTFPVTIAGEIRGLDSESFVPKKDQRRMDPFTLYGVAAAQLAIQDSGLIPADEDLDRVGVVIGSGTGGIHVMLEQARVLDSRGVGRFSPFTVPQMIINILCGHIAIQYGFRGPNFALTTACATATHSIGEAMRIIQSGDADVMLAGGSEGSINELGVGGFCAIRALTSQFNDQPKKASRPFDRDRSGFVISEGAGILVLEDRDHAMKRGARIYAELAGYGRTCDAHHITAPLENGSGAAKAMSLAMNDAGVTPEQVDYINAHGTSTELNDACETRAIKQAFGDELAHRVPISSTKSVTGHLLGAAGGVEATACLFAIRDDVIPPTINYENPDPVCDLDYVPNTARECSVDLALSNSLGFGGHNACLCFRKDERR